MLLKSTNTNKDGYNMTTTIISTVKVAREIVMNYIHYYIPDVVS